MGNDGASRKSERRGERAGVPDPKLRALSETILAMPVEDRLRQLEAEAAFFSSVRPFGE